MGLFIAEAAQEFRSNTQKGSNLGLWQPIDEVFIGL